MPQPDPTSLPIHKADDARLAARAADAAIRSGHPVGPLHGANLPFGFADVAALDMRIMQDESYTLLHELIDDEKTSLDPHVRPRIAAGRTITAQAYIEALYRRQAMKKAFMAALDGIGALLTPTTMTTALPLDEVDQTSAPAHYTRFGNFLELCGLALPNGFDGGGLPTSLQIICRPYDEATALRIGWAYQDATDWHLRRPAE